MTQPEQPRTEAGTRLLAPMEQLLEDAQWRVDHLEGSDLVRAIVEAVRRDYIASRDEVLAARLATHTATCRCGHADSQHWTTSGACMACRDCALPLPAFDALLQEVGRVAVGVANDWMGDPDHGFILDRLAAPVDAWRAALSGSTKPSQDVK